MKHNLPQSIEDVKPEHNIFIATEILKLKRKMEIWTERHPLTGKKIQYSDDRWVLPNGDMYGSKALNFYTNIQHSKMLDVWVINNKKEIFLKVSTGISISCNKKTTHYFCEIVFYEKKYWRERSVEKRLSYCYSQSESFARTTAIVKAWLEINKKQGEKND